MADHFVLLFSYPPDSADTLNARVLDKKTKEYIAELHRIPQSFWVKSQKDPNLLDTIDPTTNTIAYMFALRHQIAASGKDTNLFQTLQDRCQILFANFNPYQVRYVPDLWGFLLSWVFDEGPNTKIALELLATAMLRLDPTAGTFTSFHLRFVKACLEAGLPSQALPILDKNIYAFPQTQSKQIPEDLLCEDIELSNTFITKDSGFTAKLSPQHVLEYYLLGAHVYIGQLNYSRARLFLEYVILYPTQQHVASAYQVEAYKKWLLVGLLAEGNVYPLPHTVDQQVLKSLKALGKPYAALAEDFARRDGRKFDAEMELGSQMWFDDGNARLVLEVRKALQRYSVIDLQKTYAALPISRVATYLGISADAALNMLTDMTRSGHLHASLSPSPGSSTDAVLRFRMTATVTKGAAMQEKELQAQTLRIEDLVTFVRDADRRLQITKEYTDHVKRTKRAGQGLDGDLADQMDLTWDAPIPGLAGDEGDEDIMAG